MCLIVGLTACSTFSNTENTTNATVVSSPVTTSVLDQALPQILAEHQTTTQPSNPDIVTMVTPKDILKPKETVAISEDDDDEDTSSRATLRYSTRDLECLATNAYFEAGAEGDRGMAAVSYVVLNRVKSKRYKNSICGVIYQRGQFSWTFDNRSNTPPNKAHYARAKRIAREVLESEFPNPVGRSLSFHNKHCKPSWTRKMSLVVRIGGHLFYA